MHFSSVFFVIDRLVDCCSISLLLVHVIVFGVLVGRLVLPHSLNQWTKIGATGCLGFLALGMEILFLGYFSELQPVALSASSVVTLLVLYALVNSSKTDLAKSFKSAGEKLLETVRTEKVLSAIVFLTIGILLFSCWRRPLYGDEIQYHWAAPQFWALQTEWIQAKIKLVNGPALIEWLYTWSAVWHSSVSAHFTHLSLFFLLLIGAAGIGILIGATPLMVIAACMASPVMLNQATISFNDVGMAAFLVNAYGVLLSVDRQGQSDNSKSWLTTGLLLGAAYLSKSLGLAAVPFALAYQFINSPTITARSRIANVLWLLLPIVFAVSLGVAHTFYLTGQLSDRSRTPTIGKIPADPKWADAVYIARDPNDPMLIAGAAAGRIPTYKDILILPFTPFIAAIFGQREPYGGRTGLVLLIFLPLFFSGFRSKFNSKSKEFWLFFAAAVYFAIVAPVFIKTRFNIFAWCLLSICAAGAFNNVKSERYRKLFSIVFTLAVLLGVCDASRVVLNTMNM